MRTLRSSGLAVALAGGVALAAALATPASAQSYAYPTCPAGYYYAPGYGCLVNSYAYQPPPAYYYGYPGYYPGYYGGVVVGGWGGGGWHGGGWHGGWHGSDGGWHGGGGWHH